MHNISSPVKIVKSTLYLDFNLILSSIKPITPDKTTVKMKIMISFVKFGKKRINKTEEHEIPKIKAMPPDSATSGLDFLWISIPTCPFFFMNLIKKGINSDVITNPVTKIIIK